jgi:hypothetical protein
MNTAQAIKDDKRLARGRRFFEYHCYEGEDSSDAELWHHTHQQVIVLNRESNIDEVYVGKIYRVRFPDGFEYDVCDDELLKSPSEYYRPDYKKEDKT